MSNNFLCSDHHFSHKSLLSFKRSDGVTPLRVFNDVVHMNEYMIMQHNRVVKPLDRVYFLGDLAFHKRDLEVLGRMNGRKVLIKGNHDTLELKDYLPYFDDIRGVHQFDGFILSHMPLHTESLSRWKCNIHGHLHANIVFKTGTKIPDPRYYSVCMEQLVDYTPVSLEQVKRNLLDRGVEI